MKNRTTRPHVDPLEPRRFLSAAPIVSGVVFADKVAANNQPDPGEGMPGCVVTFNRTSDHLTFTTVTADDGSYALDVQPGTYSVNVDGPDVTTPFNQNVTIPDQDTTLNPRVGTHSSPPAPPADLAVTVTQAPPASIVPGATKVPVTVRVTNKGGAYNGPVDVTLYFSTNKTIDGSDVSLPTAHVPAVKIAAKASKDFSFDAAPLLKLLPGGGSYYVLAKITVPGDSSSANDTAASKSATKVVTPATNLTLSFAKPVTPTKQKSLPLTLTLKNTGNALASGTGTLTVVARPTKGGPDVALGTIALPGIKVQPNNRTQAVTGKSVSAASLPAGSYKLVVTLASTLSTPESKTSDNTAISGTFTIK